MKTKSEIVIAQRRLGSRYDLQIHLRSSLTEKTTNTPEQLKYGKIKFRTSDSCGTSKHLCRVVKRAKKDETESHG